MILDFYLRNVVRTFLFSLGNDLRHVPPMELLHHIGIVFRPTGKQIPAS
jgi:hypothetical protein